MLQQEALDITTVKKMPREELFDLFRKLPSPTASEFNGFFTGVIPDYSAPVWYPAIDALGHGAWQGKMYRPAGPGEDKGEGYNVFKADDGKTTRIIRFGWKIDASVVDGKPALVMHYSDYQSWACDQDLIDEVRKLSDDVFVGIYHTKEPVPGFTPRQGSERSELEVFFLVSPKAGWIPADPE